MDKVAIKAGMANIDKARVEAIIERMTKNSPMGKSTFLLLYIIYTYTYIYYYYYLLLYMYNFSVFYR